MHNSKELKIIPSELRYDIASKDWVIIATGRSKRPENFKQEKKIKSGQPKKDCPFCKIGTQEEPTFALASGKKVTPKDRLFKNWTTVAIPNKYPAVIPYIEKDENKEGPFFKKMNAVGFHEVIITRDHSKSLALLENNRVKELFDVYCERYKYFMKKSFVNYISIFHNHGPEAGASIFHPHSQIITTPLIDIDLNKAILNSKKYYKKTKKCIYCQMNSWDLKSKKRIVLENKHFLAFCPFASKAAFQVIISPKKHLYCFSKITEEQKKYLAEIFKETLRKLYKGLANPPYNFYLHTIPCDGKDYSHYHWHWTILPKTSIWAGFEMGTKMEISTIEPEKAAEYLRKQ